MSGQFELGSNHQECIKKTKELISECNNVQDYLTKSAGIYNDYLGMTLYLEEIAKQDAASAYVLADQIVYKELTQKEPSGIAGILCSEPGFSNINEIQTKAVKVEGGWQLNGVKLISNEQINSDQFLVFARDEEDRIGLFAVSKDNVKVEEVQKAVSSSNVSLNQAKIEANLSNDANIGFLNDDFERVMTIARTFVAAIAVGIGHSALIKSIETAKTTKNAKGEALSTSQSMQFTLADMFSPIEGARMLTYMSADSIDKGMPNIKFAAMAKVQASDAAAKAALDSLHLFGNIGFVSNIDNCFLLKAVESQVKGGTNRVQKAQIYEYMLAKK